MGSRMTAPTSIDLPVQSQGTVQLPWTLEDISVHRFDLDSTPLMLLPTPKPTLSSCWPHTAALCLLLLACRGIDSLAVTSAEPTTVEIDALDMRKPGSPYRGLSSSALEGKLQRLEVSMEAWALSDNYPNFFQTSDGPLGVRMELVQPNSLHLELGEGRYFKVATDFPLKTWQHLRVVVERGRSIEVFLQNRSIYRTTDAALTTLDFQVDNIALGTGFSRRRPFTGELKNFTLTAERSIPSALPILWLTKLIGAAAAVALVVVAARAPYGVTGHPAQGRMPKTFAALSVLGILAWGTGVGMSTASSHYALFITALLLLANAFMQGKSTPAPATAKKTALLQTLGLLAGCFILSAGVKSGAVHRPAELPSLLWLVVVMIGASLLSTRRQGLVYRLVFAALAAAAGIVAAQVPNVESHVIAAFPAIIHQPWTTIGTLGAMTAVAVPRIIAVLLFAAGRTHEETTRTAVSIGRMIAITVLIASYCAVKIRLLPLATIGIVHEGLFILLLVLLMEAGACATAWLGRAANLAFALLAAVGTYVGFAFLWLLRYYWVTFPAATSGKATTLSFDEIGAIYQSNVVEALGFFYSSFPQEALVTSLVAPLAAAIAMFIFTAGRTAAAFFSARRVALLTGLVVAVAASGIGQPQLLDTLRPVYRELQAKAKEFEIFREMRLEFAAPGAVVATKEARGETYVVVIGESVNPAHMGAYGYFRPTTPWLSSKVTDKDWLFFQNAYASYCHTVPSLLMALTSANQYNGQIELESPSLIEVFKAAGFKVRWLSEQGVSWTDNPLNAVAASTDSLRFVRPLGRIPELLDTELRAVDPAENNLIIIHLIGSHAPYSSRVPDGYRPSFLDDTPELEFLNAARPGFVETLLNPYDASIHYTDLTLSKIKDSLERHDNPVDGLVYVADHGEDVMGGKFHHASVFTFPMVRIPFVVYVSPKWQATYAEKFELLTQRHEKVFTLDLLFDFMLGLAEVQTDRTESKYMLTSPDYALDGDSALTMKPPPKLQENLYESTEPKKISADLWYVAKQNIKAVNLKYPGKFLGVNADNPFFGHNGKRLGFSGLEINVTVPRMTIGHYPEELTTIDVGKYLSQEPYQQFQKIWFDLKLIEGEKLVDCLPRFEELDLQYRIKQRGIIESWEPGLKQFSEAGWNTSYYIHEKIWPDITSQDPATQRATAEKINKRIADENPKSVSFFAKDYRFVKEYLEPLLPKSTTYLTWSIDLPPITESSFAGAAESHPIVNDPRVAVILIEALSLR